MRGMDIMVMSITATIITSMRRTAMKRMLVMITTMTMLTRTFTHTLTLNIRPCDDPRAADGDLNLKAAYLHVLADAATSVLAIAALLGGKLAGWLWLDAAVGLLGAVLIGVLVGRAAAADVQDPPRPRDGRPARRRGAHASAV